MNADMRSCETEGRVTKRREKVGERGGEKEEKEDWCSEYSMLQ